MKSRGSIIIHLIFWLFLALICVMAVVSSERRASVYELTVNFGYYGLINISIFYINYTLLIPQLVQQRKKYGVYIISIVLLIAFMGILKTLLAIFYNDIILTHGQQRTGKPAYTEITEFILKSVFTSGFFIVISALIKLAVDWFGNERVQRKLESEKKDMELQFLKSQLNPHFLFNSLNNIYSLAYQKSDKTADAVLKLSEIMRYMIYESNDSWVSLSKEIEYVKSFIELQKLRFKDGAAVELTLNGEIDDQKIVPLILISFVENAFKHGVANDKDNPIKINIIANQKILHFSITNKKNKQNKDEMGGVGLNNVERRLQLLYPERYKLNIVNSDTHYTSELMLDI
ncbi:sensor histidine kinase [Pedobacter nutrimenti]|jgi:sensor histidine kinase YesM|uniref:Histidine kinase n=1 Tax=Pedobacter nutrimenti TaxID=1241337 RepID=A0A318ULQ8_9SPHI|nr:sensor histidine kinase [Pedobacter nutrimenti]PYF76008.1 histidine kinase [Pedobacter nutrimenti]